LTKETTKRTRAEGDQDPGISGGERVQMRELLSFFEDDPKLLEIFRVIARQRKIRLQGLLEESSGAEKEATIERLRRLEDAGFVKSREAPGNLEDLRWYYLTSKGWAARRRVRELLELELVP
jgi:DNA-binding MarR family transcriptional regulator